MARRLNKSDRTILELAIELASQGTDDLHGYQLNKVYEARGNRAFTMSTLYRSLSRLEELGGLTSRFEQAEGRGPARRVYTLTPDAAALLDVGVAPLPGSLKPATD